jgi:hypothetical protein
MSWRVLGSFMEAKFRVQSGESALRGVLLDD